MTDRSSANAALVAGVCIIWFGFILPDLLRLQAGVLAGNGYLHYGRWLALYDLSAAAAALAVAIIAASAARGTAAGASGRGMTAGGVAVLIAQAVILVLIPAAFLASVSFR